MFISLSNRVLKLTAVGLFTCFMCACVTGCDNRRNSVQSDSILTDSIVQDSDAANSVEENNDSIVFANAEEARWYMSESPDSDKYYNGILPKMATESIDYVNRLINNKFDYFIVVDKRRMKVILFDKFGQTVKTYPCAVGRNFGTKHKKSDCRTSEGFFTAKGIYDSTDWQYTDDNGVTYPEKGVFGPRFIRLKIPGVSSIGIHGTSSPYSMGRRASHGCIRIQNENILELVKYAKVGMPIIVNPGDNDKKVNEKEGYYIPQITTRLDGIDDAPVFAMPKLSEETEVTEVVNSEEINSEYEENNPENDVTEKPSVVPVNQQTTSEAEE